MTENHTDKKSNPRNLSQTKPNPHNPLQKNQTHALGHDRRCRRPPTAKPTETHPRQTLSTHGKTAKPTP